ncbi:MAG: TetR/AcrR family transcriptional regulator [Acidobacteriaceae bacterium]|nr:TetR/AcrR family transcriptional regulator [Acidobacteriaceae bacterium]
MNTIEANPAPGSSPLGIVHAIKTARPKRIRDRSGKKKALVQAAADLFGQRGYEATPTREIAAAAGCAEGLIHRYFGGKAGLLSTIIEDRAFEEVADLNQELLPAARFEDEFVQLVEWEIERMWGDREVLKVLIPRSLLDSTVADLLRQNSLRQRTRTIVERLKRYRASKRFSDEEIEALAHSVGALGLVFGFMRPVVLGQDRDRAKKVANTIAKLLAR